MPTTLILCSLYRDRLVPVNTKEVNTQIIERSIPDRIQTELEDWVYIIDDQVQNVFAEAMTSVIVPSDEMAAR